MNHFLVPNDVSFEMLYTSLFRGWGLQHAHWTVSLIVRERPALSAHPENLDERLVSGPVIPVYDRPADDTVFPTSHVNF